MTSDLGMSADDTERFSALWLGTCESLSGRRPSEDVAVLAFAVLRRFDFDEIQIAVQQHCSEDTWAPKPADIVSRIVGQLPPAYVLVDVGRANAAPMALPVRSLLKGDLSIADPRSLCTRIKANIRIFQDFHGRASLGQYSDIEIALMVASGISVTGPIAPGMPPPRMRFINSLIEREGFYLKQKSLPPAQADEPTGYESFLRYMSMEEVLDLEKRSLSDNVDSMKLYGSRCVVINPEPVRKK